TDFLATEARPPRSQPATSRRSSRAQRPPRPRSCGALPFLEEASLFDRSPRGRRLHRDRGLSLVRGRLDVFGHERRGGNDLLAGERPDAISERHVVVGEASPHYVDRFRALVDEHGITSPLCGCLTEAATACEEVEQAVARSRVYTDNARQHA